MNPPLTWTWSLVALALANCGPAASPLSNTAPKSVVADSPISAPQPARLGAAIEEHWVDDAQALFGIARAGKSKTYEDRLSEQGYVVWDSRDPERLLEWANDDQLRWASLRADS